ncbi:MAG: hypothetical protein ACYDEY_08180 [Acidimicrobiales bacterium]
MHRYEKYVTLKVCVYESTYPRRALWIDDVKAAVLAHCQRGVYRPN